MSPTALLLAVAATILLVGVAGFAVHGKKVSEAARLALAVRAEVPSPWGVLSFGLVVFGVVTGIPLALGLADASVLSLLAAPLCCMVGTWLIDLTPKQALPQVAWYSVMAWSVSITFLVVGSFSANDPAALQAVLGPLPLHQGSVRLGALGIGLLTGVFAASRWLGLLQPPVPTPVGAVIKWGEAALAGTLVFGPGFGSGLAGLAYGVLDRTSFAWSATSIGASVLGVLAVTWLSGRSRRISDRYLFPLMAILVASASIAAVFG